MILYYSFIIFVIYIQSTAVLSEESDKYTCSSTELDKLDQISARILSLSEHQRPFPEAVVQIQRYCK